jgi:predicted ATP-binding protein involved in virulence
MKSNYTKLFTGSIQSLKNRNPESFGNKLEQHLVNIKVNQSLALTEDNNQEQAKQFQKWFDSFDSHLKFLFEDDNAHLVFYRQNFKFKISLNNREFDFQTLSSGYLAIFEILADLLVRSEFFEITPDKLQGIVLIDEIDAHLHISLQKKILPFFTKLFPQIQFIVSTHSPFVITSTDNDTVVYDISSGEFFEEDLSRYSYESVIKGLFHVNPISSDTKNSIEILKNLLIENPSNYEKIRSIVKNLVELEKNDLLDKSLKNLYLQAINLLADNNQLEDLDV